MIYKHKINSRQPSDGKTNSRRPSSGKSTKTSSRPSSSQTSADGTDLDRIGKECLKHCNNIRKTGKLHKNKGLPPLKWSQEIAEICKRHSKWLCDKGYKTPAYADRYVHKGKRGSGHYGNAGRYKEVRKVIGAKKCGENIGIQWGHRGNVAKKKAKAWYKSPGHRRPMVDPRYTKCGVGLYIH